MHLGLARAQLLPRSDGYRRFTGSPIDALVYLVGLSCQIPIRLALRTIIHRRVAALPQRWPACRGDVRGGRLHPDVVQDVADFGAVGDEGNDAHLPTAHGAQQRKCLVDAGNQHRPQVMRRSLRACFRFGCGCGRVARRRHPRYARARLCSLHRGWLRRSRLSQRRYRRSQRRVWCQHTKVAVPVGAWRWHQRGDAVDQFQRCEVQLICLGTTLVTGGLAALFGTAVHQFASLFGYFYPSPRKGKSFAGA